MADYGARSKVESEEDKLAKLEKKLKSLQVEISKIKKSKKVKKEKTEKKVKKEKVNEFTVKMKFRDENDKLKTGYHEDLEDALLFKKELKEKGGRVKWIKDIKTNEILVDPSKARYTLKMWYESSTSGILAGADTIKKYKTLKEVENEIAKIRNDEEEQSKYEDFNVYQFLVIHPNKKPFLYKYNFKTSKMDITPGAPDESGYTRDS